MSSMEDDDDDGGEGGTGKYPVMPSLVALQQMRNRLHLAYLGRKLMKWTALATGRDLRKLAQDLIYNLDSFREDVGNAYMKLARARFFYPNLNKMVIGNYQNAALVYVQTTSKSTSGVRVIQLELIETENSPYEHLGIEKGGTAIKDAKQAWLELLRRMITVLEIRSSFKDLEHAHKNATKKKNVLEKVIIPRIKASLHYILSELEEKEREETFRLKRFKQLKLKHSELARKDKLNVCKPCPEAIQYEEPIYEETIYEEPIYEEPEPVLEDIPEPVPHTKLAPIIIVPPEPKSVIAKPIKIPESVPRVEVCCSCLSLYEADPNGPVPTCPVCKKAIRVKEKQSKAKLNLKPCESTQYKKQIEDLTTHIEEVINLSKKYKMEGIVSPSIENFIQACNSTKEKIEDYANASVCGSVHKDERSTFRPASTTGSAKSVASRSSDKSRPPSREPASPAEPITPKALAETASAEELGYFESKFKEVVKVTRLQNEDGTITEERQVITVKTERKNPRKPDTVDGCFGQQRFIGSCACHSDIKRNLSIRERISSDNYIDSDCKHHRGDGRKTSRPSSPRKTKSEQMHRCQPMVEPKLRACLSVGPKSLCGDASYTNKSCLSNVSSKEIPMKVDSCVKCSRIPITRSVDSGCCYQQSPMICTERPRPHVSKLSLNKPIKMVANKATSCHDQEIVKVLTLPVSKDVGTSTTDLKLLTKIYCGSVDSIHVKKKKKLKSDSCCKIKIIIKPQKVDKVEEKIKNVGVNVTDSLLGTLNRLLPCHDTTETSRDWSEIENICLKCLSKLHSKPSTCTICHDPPEDALEIDGPCKNCLAKMGANNRCTDKLKGLLQNGEICQKCVDRLIDSIPCGLPCETCRDCQLCKEKLDEFARNGFCKACLEKNNAVTPCRTPVDKALELEVDGTSSSCYSCKSFAVDTNNCECPTPRRITPKSSRKSIRTRISKALIKSDCCSSCAERKDASTLTKRCNRFDVRPIGRRHTCEATLPTTKSKQLRRTRSLHEKDYHYFGK